MSKCLTWFPIGGYRRTIHISKLGGFYKKGGILQEFSTEKIIGSELSHDIMVLITKK